VAVLTPEAEPGPAERVAAAWIAGGWIFSADAAQDGKYWIADGWIYGPLGAEDARTGFNVHGNWIYGPRTVLPFVR